MIAVSSVRETPARSAQQVSTDASTADADTPNASTAGTGTAAPRTPATTDELVRANLPLVGHIVREVLGRVPAHVSRDELLSAGMYALAVSASSFDESRGVPFARFAAIRIRGAITDELRTMDWASRAVRSKAREVETARADLQRRLGRSANNTEVAQSLGVPTGDVNSVDADVHRASVLSLQALTVDGPDDVLPSQGESPEGLLVRREQIGYLRDAIEQLPERLRTVVQRYFFDQHKMSDIAVDLGVTESRVSQLRSEALTMLRAGFSAVDAADAAPAPVARPANRRTDQRGRAGALSAYVESVTTHSSLLGRLSATTLLGESRLGGAPILTAAS